MPFLLTPSRAGVLLAIRVKPRAKINSIIGARDEKILVAVTAAPTDGAANAAVLSVLAKTLGVAPSRLSVARGRKSREKMIAISTLSIEEIQLRLTDALPSD
jgi:uncharacterized protein (TIGR00251 family)